MDSRRFFVFSCALVLALTLAAPARATDPPFLTANAADELTVEERRCLTPDPWFFPHIGGTEDTADCNGNSTNPDPMYDPGPVYEIPVVVHIITNTSGTGDLSDALVQSQIDILNEDFLALTGTNGENGIYTGIRFVLATEDPNGDPTTGITRTANNSWFADNAGFKAALGWDQQRYLNFYTNNTGALGYAWFPWWGINSEDGVVVYYRSFGRNSSFPPYHQGRTATHEVGHYLGLYHPFQGSCGIATPPGCYSSGDLICDTEPDSTSHFGCPNTTSCNPPVHVPVENYMEYTDDLCMEWFTTEQMRKMRCALTSYRTQLYSIVDDSFFSDGFESGDTTAWSNTVP